MILDLSLEQSEQAALDLIDWFEAEGQAEKGEIRALGLGCDVSDEEQVIEAFGKIVKKFGRIDVLVTAAGIVGQFTSAHQSAKRETFSIFRILADIS